MSHQNMSPQLILRNTLLGCGMIIVPTFIFILSLEVNPNSYQSSWLLSHKLEKDIASGGKRSKVLL